MPDSRLAILACQFPASAIRQLPCLVWSLELRTRDNEVAIACVPRDMLADEVRANANVLDQNGQQLTAIGGVIGLNLDPTGGIWLSPQTTGLISPALVFMSVTQLALDTIFSTNPKGGVNGSAAVINGVTSICRDASASSALSNGPQREPTTVISSITIGASDSV